ncbi:hypothetical protein LJC45_03205, partial [Alistipes sp. OttesenSCG-928-B03]|nr:hypothetical protein [Alistipes sp. OttesenSCG-928-B03]
SASTWQQSGTQTSEYELLHTQYCGNLKSISWRGGRVECLYSAQSGGSPLSKLDEIKIYSMQNEHRYSLHFNYGNFVGANSAWQPLKLLSVERRGATDRLLLARFDYHETWALPHRDSYDTDHWGYYNRANNLSHCPLFAYNGTECSGANRTPSLEAARSGMLKRVYSVYGGFSEYDYELNTTAAGASGGLRISSIRQAAEENDPGQITRFRYVTAGGNASSGQSLRSVGDYACGGSTGFAVVASRNRYECMDVAGFTTGYSRVEELLPNGSYRVYNYAFNGGIDPEVYAIPSGSTVAQNATFFPVALRFGEQGMLSSCVSYDAEGSEVARESYTYPAAPQSRAIISGNAPVQIQGPATEGTFRYAGRYIWVSRSILPASVTVSGDDTPGYTTTIMRDNDTCLPLETVTTTAAGDTYITQTRYPFQYDVSDVPASASDANAIRTMQENHMLSVPVEEVVYKNGRVTDGSLNTYRVIETTHSARSIVPASQRVLKLAASLAAFTPASFAANGALSCDAAYKPVMWFDYYDVWGNLLQYHEEEGKPISFVYGYDNSVAIAQITGAEARDGRVNGRENEVFYTSFEDDPLAETIDAKSGRKARRGPIVIPSDGFKQSVAYHTTWQMNYISGRSQLISTSYTTQAKYIVTWWGSLDGGKTWEPYRSTISILPVDGFTVGTAAHYVDEVSIIPENASITTSTWIPGVGKTSEGTGNGYTTYYRYDAFGRPVHILDNRKEETHSYKYQ